MSSIEIRNPTLSDTREIIELFQNSGKLDVNSSYYYALWIKEWSGTCAVAALDGCIIGALTGFVRPTDPSVYFAWQTCISPATQENNLALRLYEYVLQSLIPRGVTHLEMTIDGQNRFVRLMLANLARRYEADVEDGGILFSTELLANSHYPEELRRISVVNGIR